MMNRSMTEIVRRQTPATLPSSATVEHACRLMRDRQVGAVLVTGIDGHLVGLFTGRDAVTRVGAEALDPSRVLLRTVMTAHPHTIGPQAHAIDALRVMQDGGYRHLPILDGTKIAGIVSQGDFKGLELARLDEETRFWELL